MPQSCPHCSRSLPQLEDPEYRFCPYCGAEIKIGKLEPGQRQQTIPPDLHAQSDAITAPRFNRHADPASTRIPQNQTLAPELTLPRTPPDLTPPAGLAPPSFYRARSANRKADSEFYPDASSDGSRKILVFVLFALSGLTILAAAAYWVLTHGLN